MVAELRDLSWMRHTAVAKVTAEFNLSPFRAAILSIPPGKGEERFVFRMMFYEGGSLRPCFAVSLERTILGSWCVSSESAAGSVVHEHLAVAPSQEAFAEKALAIATPALDALLAASRIPKPKNAPKTPKTATL